MNVDLTVIRGDTAVYRCTVTIDGVPADLTGHSIFFTLKPSLTTTDANKTFQKSIGSGVTVTNAAAGEFEVKLLAADLKPLTPGKTYYWDIQIIQPDGSVNTPLIGNFFVSPDVNNAIS